MDLYVQWLVLLLLCTSALAPGVAAEDGCYGATVRLVVEAGGNTEEFRAYVSGIGKGVTRKEPKTPLLAALAQPQLACNDTNNSEELQGRAVLVERGECTFLRKAQVLEQAGSALMIVYNNQPGCVVMGTNETNTLPISAISVSEAVGERLLKLVSLEAETYIKAWTPYYNAFDPSAVLLWVLAVSTVSGGAIWAGKDHCKDATSDEDLQVDNGKVGRDIVLVTGRAAVVFVLLASIMLLLMFFLLNHIFTAVLVVLFCLASVQALTMAFTALLSRIAPKFKVRVDIPFSGSVPYSSLVALPISSLIATVWAVFRNGNIVWVLQDGMGVAIILMILRQFRLPNVKVASVLLPLCFVYDVFWVFIQPLMTHSPSVMVEVATGGGAHEHMPMLLMIPRLRDLPEVNFSMLGFGDLVLPGLLIVYCRVYDLDHKVEKWAGYFYPAMVGYGVGLFLTYVALLLDIGGTSGQPALLYLVPCTLGTVFVLAKIRGHLGDMWDANEMEREDSHTGVQKADIELPSRDVEEGATAHVETTGLLRDTQPRGTGPPRFTIDDEE